MLFIHERIAQISVARSLGRNVNQNRTLKFVRFAGVLFARVFPEKKIEKKGKKKKKEKRTLLAVRWNEDAADQNQKRRDHVDESGVVRFASRHRPLPLVHAAHFFVPARFRGSSPNCQHNTVIVTTLKFAGSFRVVVLFRVVDLPIDDERTHPHSGEKETFASTARLSLATGRKQNPTFTWWLRASRGGAGTSRPSRSFPPSPFYSAASPVSLFASTRLCDDQHRGDRYLEKPWGRVLAKIWERPGTTFFVSSRRSLDEDQRSFATILEPRVNAFAKRLFCILQIKELCRFEDSRLDFLNRMQIFFTFCFRWLLVTIFFFFVRVDIDYNFISLSLPSLSFVKRFTFELYILKDMLHVRRISQFDCNGLKVTRSCVYI